jgi:hypothetical protein
LVGELVEVRILLGLGLLAVLALAAGEEARHIGWGTKSMVVI